LNIRERKEIVIVVAIALVFLVVGGYEGMSYLSSIQPVKTMPGIVINQRCIAPLGFCWSGGYNDTVKLSNGTIIYAGDTCQEGGRGGLPLGVSMNFSYYPKEGWIQSTDICM
jgi:hypothetical protein